MFNLGSIEHDLLEMKAATLSKYGKKLEMAEQMYHEKLRLKERLEKMLKRLETEKVITSGWFRKKRQTKLKHRIEGKLEKAEKSVVQLTELKDRYMAEFKAQREACGMMDHTFIDEFYQKD